MRTNRNLVPKLDLPHAKDGCNIMLEMRRNKSEHEQRSLMNLAAETIADAQLMSVPVFRGMAAKKNRKSFADDIEHTGFVQKHYGMQENGLCSDIFLPVPSSAEWARHIAAADDVLRKMQQSVTVGAEVADIEREYRSAMHQEGLLPLDTLLTNIGYESVEPLYGKTIGRFDVVNLTAHFEAKDERGHVDACIIRYPVLPKHASPVALPSFRASPDGVEEIKAVKELLQLTDEMRRGVDLGKFVLAYVRAHIASDMETLKIAVLQTREIIPFQEMNLYASSSQTNDVVKTACPVMDSSVRYLIDASNQHNGAVPDYMALGSTITTVESFDKTGCSGWVEWLLDTVAACPALMWTYKVSATNSDAAKAALNCDGATFANVCKFMNAIDAVGGNCDTAAEVTGWYTDKTSQNKFLTLIVDCIGVYMRETCAHRNVTQDESLPHEIDDVIGLVRTMLAHARSFANTTDKAKTTFASFVETNLKGSVAPKVMAHLSDGAVDKPYVTTVSNSGETTGIQEKDGWYIYRNPVLFDSEKHTTYPKRSNLSLDGLAVLGTGTLGSRISLNYLEMAQIFKHARRRTNTANCERKNDTLDDPSLKDLSGAYFALAARFRIGTMFAATLHGKLSDPLTVNGEHISTAAVLPKYLSGHRLAYVNPGDWKELNSDAMQADVQRRPFVKVDGVHLTAATCFQLNTTNPVLLTAHCGPWQDGGGGKGGGGAGDGGNGGDEMSAAPPAPPLVMWGFDAYGETLPALKCPINDVKKQFSSLGPQFIRYRLLSGSIGAIKNDRVLQSMGGILSSSLTAVLTDVPPNPDTTNVHTPRINNKHTGASLAPCGEVDSSKVHHPVHVYNAKKLAHHLFDFVSQQDNGPTTLSTLSTNIKTFRGQFDRIWQDAAACSNAHYTITAMEMHRKSAEMKEKQLPPMVVALKSYIDQVMSPVSAMGWSAVHAAVQTLDEENVCDTWRPIDALFFLDAFRFAACYAMDPVGDSKFTDEMHVHILRDFTQASQYLGPIDVDDTQSTKAVWEHIVERANAYALPEVKLAIQLARTHGKDRKLSLSSSPRDILIDRVSLTATYLVKMSIELARCPHTTQQRALEALRTTQMFEHLEGAYKYFVDESNHTAGVDPSVEDKALKVATKALFQDEDVRKAIYASPLDIVDPEPTIQTGETTVPLRDTPDHVDPLEDIQSNVSNISELKRHTDWSATTTTSVNRRTWLGDDITQKYKLQNGWMIHRDKESPEEYSVDETPIAETYKKDGWEGGDTRPVTMETKIDSALAKEGGFMQGVTDTQPNAGPRLLLLGNDNSPRAGLGGADASSGPTDRLNLWFPYRDGTHPVTHRYIGSTDIYGSQRGEGTPDKHGYKVVLSPYVSSVDETSS
tara:strand:+ start:562 stop:4683 length:4122 start_codon:yes stop_codon:yes gene_type:complete